mgnify:CR=1 FL=1
MFDTLNSALEMRKGYGDVYILGKVVINNDPLNKGLVKVEAPGLYDTGLGDVPWVGLLRSSPFGQAKDWGFFGSPYPGSDVALELQNGDPNYGLYHSVQRYAAPPEFSKSGKVWGFKDPIGNIFRIDLETREVKFDAAAGVSITISPNGELTIVSRSDTTINAPNLKINANIQHTGTLYSNGVNVGSDHKHDGVKAGGDISGEPIR